MIHVWEEWKKGLRGIFNRCWEYGIFPRVWKRGRIRWLPKPGGGYRPISLLPTLEKNLDRLVNGRMMNWYEREGRTSSRQYGFRRSKNTVEALKEVLGRVNGFHERGWHVLVVALDLRNAFNMAWPPYVDERMRRDGVSGRIREIAWDFLCDREVVSGRVSRKVERGCPQGSSLGPTLWLVCMNEWLEKVVKEDERGGCVWTGIRRRPGGPGRGGVCKGDREEVEGDVECV